MVGFCKSPGTFSWGMLFFMKTQVPYAALSLLSLNLLIPRSAFVKNYKQKDWKKRNLSSSVGLFYCHMAWDFPLLVSQLYLTDISVYKLFTLLLINMYCPGLEHMVSFIQIHTINCKSNLLENKRARHPQVRFACYRDITC